MSYQLLLWGITVAVRRGSTASILDTAHVVDYVFHLDIYILYKYCIYLFINCDHSIMPGEDTKLNRLPNHTEIVNCNYTHLQHSIRLLLTVAWYTKSIVC